MNSSDKYFKRVMGISDKYFKEEDIREFLKSHACTVNWDGTQLLYADEKSIWRDMLNALPVYTKDEIINEV